ncbi:MAG: 3-oxoacyl-ACP reductase FabG [Chloroflexi bacterium]|nr:3-oxoacyl-ACP reductase FabG [Chloroflexota bacterium]
MSTRQPLRGKIALVTGGSRGIGRAIVLALAAAGADVVVNYRVSREMAEAVAACAARDGVRALPFQADVTDEAAVQRLFAMVGETFGRLDVLVNNAGVMTQFRLEEVTAAEWDRTIATNLRGVFLCCRAASALLPRGGRVINIASQLAHAGAAELTHYCASKGAVLLFTRALAREWGPRGITVNAVAPGPVLTDLTRPYADEAWIAMKTADLALGRMGTPEEVAQTVVFLCTTAAALYTGQSLNPNGGGAMM